MFYTSYVYFYMTSMYKKSIWNPKILQKIVCIVIYIIKTKYILVLFENMDSSVNKNCLENR